MNVNGVSKILKPPFQYNALQYTTNYNLNNRHKVELLLF